MTGKAGFGAEESTRLKRAPFVAGNTEDGFMGFHAERVSEGEQRMREKLAKVLAPPA